MYVSRLSYNDHAMTVAKKCLNEWEFTLGKRSIDKKSQVMLACIVSYMWMFYRVQG